MRTLPSLRSLTRRYRRAELVSLVLWIAAGAGLEFTGRHVTSDRGDFMALLLLVTMAMVTASWHRQQPLRWVTRLGVWVLRLRRRVGRLELDLGVDFRGQPAIPGQPPTLLVRGLALGSVLLLGTVVGKGLFPGAAREALCQVSYLLYLVLMAGLWLLLAGGTLLLLFLPLAFVHDAFVRQYRGPEPRSLRPEALTMVGMLALLATAAWWFPDLPVVLQPALVLVALGGLAIPCRTHLTLLWRPRHAPGEVRSFRWRVLAGSQIVFMGLVCGVLTMLSRGDGGGAQEGARTGLTRFLGLVFSWAAVGGLAALAAQVLNAVQLRLRTALAARRRPPLYLRGPVPFGLRRRLRHTLGRAGFHLHFGAAPEGRGLLEVLWASGEPHAGPRDPWESTWPRVVTEASLAEPDTWRLLQRRDEVQKRRRLMRTVERLLKFAASRRFEQGAGFWLGLHYWFVTGLTRDKSEEQSDLRRDSFFDEIIGPPYHRLLSFEVRDYLARVLGALDVDLIFLEDGVGHRRFRRVLEALFEVYDVFGGSQRVDEKHFTGIPGVRVVLHDFELENPYRSRDYPEPDYDDIGRARVLHVFRDRGGDQEELDHPLDREDLPAPRLAPLLPL